MSAIAFAAAEADFNRALALDPGCVDARRRLISLYAQQGDRRRLPPSSRVLARTAKLDFLELLVWTLARHEPLDAADLADALARAVREDPGRPCVAARAGRVLPATRSSRRSRSTLAPLPSADPEACAARARIALDRGDVGGKPKPYSRRPKAAEDHPVMAQLQGRLALARDDVPAAVRYFRPRSKAAPDDRDTKFGLAQALRLSGQSDDARPFAEAARARIISNGWSRPPDPSTAVTIPRPYRQSRRHALLSTDATRRVLGINLRSDWLRTIRDCVNPSLNFRTNGALAK